MATSLLSGDDNPPRAPLLLAGGKPRKRKRRSETGGGGDKKGTPDAIGTSIGQLSGLSVVAGLVSQVAKGGPDTGVGAGAKATKSGAKAPGSRRSGRGGEGGQAGADAASAAGANDGPGSPGPFAHGGLVRKSDLGPDVDGPGGEGGTIQVKGGEFVMQPSAVAFHGPEMMARINEGKIPVEQLRRRTS